ncbi:hypothetical protein Q5752_005170 [Cryptotrichosporon argae]
MSDARPTTLSAPAQSSPRTPHLPLPPPLPYSPTSVPVMRHLDALSLALLNGPDDSWAVYSALHPSLRPFVPDATFASLLAHQLSAKLTYRWERTAELLRLARECGMRPALLGAATLERAVACGLNEVARMRPSGEAWTDSQATLKWLWAGLGDALNGDYAAVGVDVRRLWVRQFLRRDTPRRTAQAARVLDGLMECGAASGLKTVMHDVVMRPVASTDQANVFDRAVRYIRHGARLAPHEVATLVERRFRSSGDIDLVSDAVRRCADELRTNGIEDAAAHFTSSLAKLHTGLLRPEERVRRRLQDDPHVTFGRLTRDALAILRQDAPDLESVLHLVDTALSREGDADALVAAVVYRLSAPDHLVSVASAILDPTRRAFLSPTIFSLLLNRLVPLLPDTSVYPAARRLYAAVRAADPPYHWTSANTALWRRLVRAAAAHRHLHFASRLYADLLADGQSVPAPLALELIRAIGAADNASRAVLLDRHIRDYRWAGHDDAALCTALADGLGRTPRGAYLALDLVARIMGGLDSVPEQAIAAIAHGLATSYKQEHQLAALGVLDRLEPAFAGAYFDKRIAALVKRKPRVVAAGMQVPGDGTAGPAAATFDLAPVIDAYRQLAGRGLVPSSRTVSSLVRALLQAKHTEEALRVFTTAVNLGVFVRSDAVGRLMVGLEVAGRPGDADEVERMWRAALVDGESASVGRQAEEIDEKKGDASAPSNPRLKSTWTKAVDGARIILDVRRGKDVDVAAAEKRMGWKANAATKRWIAAMRDEQRRMAGPAQYARMRGTQA